MFDMVYTKKIDRAELISLARDILEREGIEAVSMRRLAQQMNVRVSSLYHHYEDKSQLLRAIAEAGLAELAGAITAARAHAGVDVRRQVREMAAAYRGWALSHPRLYMMLYLNRPLDAQPTAIDMSVAAPMLAAVTEMVGDKRAIAATRAVWAFVHGFVMLELAGQMRRGNPGEGFQLGLDALVRGLPGN